MSDDRFLSQADFARRRGVSRKAVTAWKQKGLLVVSDAGLIDVEALEWNLDQRPANYRGGVTHRPIRSVPGNTTADEPTGSAKPKPDTWQKLGAAMPRPAALPDGDDEGEDIGPLDPTNLPLPEAIRRKENFLGLQRKQEVEKNEGKLVDREVAEKLFSTRRATSAMHGYQFILAPILTWFGALIGVAGGFAFPAPPTLTTSDFMPVLIGMLGLGAQRTYERVSGVSTAVPAKRA